MLLIPIPQAVAFPVEIDVSTDDPALDLTTVSSVTLSVTREIDGTTASWTATVQTGATATSLSAVYELTVTDAVTLGRYDVAVFLNGPNVPSDAIGLFVVPANRWRRRS